jgi:acyl-coenzyme A synthetase/AMP-(fatty) acid ligase
VRGSGLMSGYWGDKEKTRRVLVGNPFQTAYDEPAYRTGDLVTLDDEGNYVFLGRRDGMVKTRGYRVEVGEVEAALYCQEPQPARWTALALRSMAGRNNVRKPHGTGDDT